MSDFTIPLSSKILKVLSLEESARKGEDLAEFERPVDERMRIGLCSSGMQGAAHRASSCMGWIWRQWLLGNTRQQLLPKVERLVERGLELRDLSNSYDYLAVHDLYLLHCSIFVGSDRLMEKVVKTMADSAGDKGIKPMDNGEIYAAAWSGMLKYWILGDDARAAKEAELIWSARRDHRVFASPKSLVIPWLKRDWKKFIKAQGKDFERMWKSARKDHWTIRAETSTEITVTTERYQIEHMWCWAHCGLALLAHKQGAPIIHDQFWFPEISTVKAGNYRKKAIMHDADQPSLL